MKLFRCIFGIVFVLTIYPVYQLTQHNNSYDHVMIVLFDHWFGIVDDDNHK